MRVGLDFDDTIGDTLALKRKYLSDKFGLPLENVVDIKSYIIERYGSEAYGKAIKEMYADSEYAKEHLQPKAGSLETIALMKSKGINIQVVTSRSADSLACAEIWLKHNKIDDIYILVFEGVHCKLRKEERKQE